MWTALVAFAAGFTPLSLPTTPAAASSRLALCPRCNNAVAILAEGPEGTRPLVESKPDDLWWTTESGLRVRDEVVGSSAVDPDAFVKLVTTVTLPSSGKEVDKTTQVVRLSKLHPLWEEAVRDIRVGGRRKVLLLPSSEYAKLEETVAFAIEVVREESGAAAAIAKVGGVRTIQFALLALSFVPYFLPEELKPSFYQAVDPATIAATKQQAAAAAASSWATQGLQNVGIF